MSTTLLEIASLPALISTAQAASILGCHPNLVMRMCREGDRFQAVRIGKEWRINTADFIRWTGLEEDVGEIRRELGVGSEPTPAPKPVVPVIVERAGRRHVRFVPSSAEEVLIG